MMATPDFALYECLCECLDHPPSTITVMAGSPSWKLPLFSQLSFFSTSLSHGFLEFSLPACTYVFVSSYEGSLGHDWNSHGAHRFLQLTMPLPCCHLSPHCSQIGLPPPVPSGPLHLLRGFKTDGMLTDLTVPPKNRSQTIPTLSNYLDSTLTLGRVSIQLFGVLTNLVQGYYPAALQLSRYWRSFLLDQPR